MKKKASGNYELHSTFKTKTAQGLVGASTHARQTSRIQAHNNINNTSTYTSLIGGEWQTSSCCVLVEHETENMDSVS